MAPNGFRQLQLNFSGIGCWLMFAAGLALITTVGVGWLFKSLLVLLLLLILVPIVLVVGVQFWLRRNLVEGACPSCSQPLTGLNKMPLSCPSCGVQLQVSNGAFSRMTPEGTIDVDVINVDVANADNDSTESVKTVDVEILPPADP
ncbi:hypothetical protein Lepto7375DRAFT_6035 [Leptolyngbya sp. PCC 7375]|nr:hypothetical protein Lepto7375DRAFT_6035 [Leptolyngbya sp. PCC 7375]